MKKGWKHFVLILTTCSIASSSLVFAVMPQKVSADAGSCLAGIIAGKLQGVAVTTAAATAGAASIAIAVPTYDAAGAAMGKANASINSNTSGQTQGFTIQRCIVEPLVTTIARSLLSNFTAQTVKWINSGFKGSPLYVTNVQGFFTDVADQAVGQYIEGLGAIGELLCSPFDLQLRLSLGIEYGRSGYEQEIGCRLSTIQQNVQNAFTSGNFGNDGWKNWVNITAQPQNNPYGAYLKAVDSIDARIGNTQLSIKTQLDWGKGFLSSTDPETGEISTPGTVIEGQLNKVLAQPYQNLGVARDIDAILNALVGEMINQVIGPNGLLGATQRPSTGGQSAVDRAINKTVNDALASNTQAQTTLPATFLQRTNAAGGTETITTQQFCQAFKINQYFRDTTNNTVKVKVGTVGTNGAITRSTAAVTWYVGGTPATLENYNHASNYCQNVVITGSVSDATSDFNEKAVGPKIPEPEIVAPTGPVQKNLAAGKEAKQSSTFTGFSYYPDAKIAVDGQTTGSENYGLALTQDSTEDWWQVDLGESKSIGTIKIYRSITGRFLDYPFYVFVTNSDMRSMTVSDILTDTSGAVTAKIPVDTEKAFGNKGSNSAEIQVQKTGRYVRIAKSRGTYMGLAEVEVYAPTETTGAAAAGNQNQPLSFSQNGDDSVNLSYGESINKKPETVLLANQDFSNLQVRMKLTGINAFSRQEVTLSLPVYFNTFVLTEKQGGQTKNFPLLVPNQTTCKQSYCNSTINTAYQTLSDNTIIFDKSFSVKSGDTIPIDLVAKTSNTFISGSYKIVLEVTDATGKVLATYTKNVSLGK